MPCHVSWHETDDARAKVLTCRKDAIKVVTAIRDLERTFGIKSAIPAAMRLEIVMLMDREINLPMVKVKGLDNKVEPGQEKIIKYLNMVGMAYGALYENLVVEACRMCKIGFRKPGPLPRSAGVFWQRHKCSEGHDG